MNLIFALYIFGCLWVAIRQHKDFMYNWSSDLPKIPVLLGWILTISFSWFFYLIVELIILYRRKK
jgi:hypothetical protein